jgi:SAM-dependent methyltransferase
MSLQEFGWGLAQQACLFYCRRVFFRNRSTQAEYFDRPGRAESEAAAEFRELDRLNRFFQPSLPFSIVLPRWLGAKSCAQLEILDIGAGTGWLGRELSQWAARRGWTWRFTNLDTNEVALRLGNRPGAVNGNALALPFANGSFDLVITSQMTHHLTDPEIIIHWREAARVTRDGLFFCDLHRNVGLYAMLWLTTRLLGASRHVREDALISVKRGFRCNEWRVLAAQAELRNARVWIFYGTRIVLQARKSP